MSKVIISHSEVDAFIRCQQAHYYSFGDRTFVDRGKPGLEPKTFSDALYRGTLGHEALEGFFKALQETHSFSAAVDASDAVMQASISRPDAKFQIIGALQGKILPRFFKAAEQFVKDGWFPEYVEKVFELEWDFGDGPVVYPFKPDAVMKDRAGNLWLWDHKFVYNFYNADEIALYPQIPKYIGALRALGYYVKGGYYNQIRHREVKDEQNHVRLDKLVPSNTRVQNAFKQQIHIMGKIAELKKGRQEDWIEQAALNRNMSSMSSCKLCSFKMLCGAEINGTDTSLMKKIEFGPNTYGYGGNSSGD